MESSATSRSPEAGFSLIELMAAMLILGVILSAMASALISFSVTTVTNERRVQATALLTAQHEQLQSIPWERAFIYSDDAADLAPLGINLVPNPPMVDGEPLVVEEGPDVSACDFEDEDTDEDCGRLTFVPKAQEIVEVDGRDYEVLRAVTWDESLGSGRAVKRFTTLVRWEVRGRFIEQTFESTRAGTAAELGNPDLPEVVSLIVSPGTVQLDAAGRSLAEVSVRITYGRGITSAELAYTAYQDDSPVLRKVPMTAIDFDDDSKPFAFEAFIPADSDTFLVEDQDLVATGMDGLNPVVASRTVSFIEMTSGGAAPEVTSVIPNLSHVEVGTKGASEGRLCQTLTVRARVYYLEGGSVPGTVTANYIVGTATGASMDGPATITGNDEFLLTFPAGELSPWKPTAATYAGNSGNIKDPAVDVTDRFDVVAENPDGAASTIKTSAGVVFRAKTSNGGLC